MSEEQHALPTLVKKTAIIGVRNIYDYPEALLELQDTFKRSLNLPKTSDKDVEKLCNPFKLLVLSYGFINFIRFYLFHKVLSLP